MKALVISDIHGSGYYADKIREIVERENPEKIILLGDLYYHGPRNDLSQEYNPMKVAETLNSMKDRLLVVRGNCDAEVDEMISEFKFNDHILMEINGKKFYFTHGHKYNIENKKKLKLLNESSRFDICKSRVNITTKMQHSTQLYHIR